MHVMCVCVCVDPPTPPLTACICTGPLNRAEWIKFVSLFFNKEAEANALFDNITSEYESVQVRLFPPMAHTHTRATPHSMPR